MSLSQYFYLLSGSLTVLLVSRSHQRKNLISYRLPSGNILLNSIKYGLWTCLSLWIGGDIVWRLKGMQDANTNQLYFQYRPTTIVLSMKWSTFPSRYTGTNTSSSLDCFKGMFLSNIEGVKLLILSAWGAFQLWGSQTSYRERSLDMLVAISLRKHKMKEKNNLPKVSLKYSRYMSDTMVMHIAAILPLNEPLLYADLTSYFAMAIFLSRLALLSEFIYCIVLRRQWTYIRGGIWYWGIILLGYF